MRASKAPAEAHGFRVTVRGREASYALHTGASSTAADVLAALDGAHHRRDIAPWVPVLGVLVVYVAVVVALAFKASLLGFVVASGLSIGLMAGVYAVAHRVDKRAKTTSIEFILDEEARVRFNGLVAGLKRLAACNRVWHVPMEGRAGEMRLKFNAHHFLRRYPIRPVLARPIRLMTNLKVPTIYSEQRKFFFFPDRVLVFDESGVSAVAFDALGMRSAETLCVEDEDVPLDAATVDSAWLHALPDGRPDPAAANNKRFPVVLYAELEFAGAAGERELFLCSQADGPLEFVAAVTGERAREPAGSDEPDGEDTSDDAETTAADEIAEIYDDALRCIVRENQVTLELLVGAFDLEFGRAAMLLAVLEADGYVGPAYRHQPRAVLGSARRYVALLDATTEERPDDDPPRYRRRRRQGRTVRRPAHEVLGIGQHATRDEITDAFRGMAQLYHPDKVASLAPEFRDVAERRMKEISAAYSEMLKAAAGERR